jgi:hypothetical protein
MEPRSGARRKLKPRCIVNYTTSRWPAIHAYLVPAGAGHYRLQLNTALRRAAQADAGDVVDVKLRLDCAPRTLPIPPDLRTGLKKHPRAWKALKALAPGHHRQFIQWYDSAKAPETRRRRLERAIDILLERALLSPRRQQRFAGAPPPR